MHVAKLVRVRSSGCPAPEGSTAVPHSLALKAQHRVKAAISLDSKAEAHLSANCSAFLPASCTLLSWLAVFLKPAMVRLLQSIHSA